MGTCKRLRISSHFFHQTVDQFFQRNRRLMSKIALRRSIIGKYLKNIFTLEMAQVII